MKVSIVFLGCLFALLSDAGAVPVLPAGRTSFGADVRYQIGQEWGKKFVTDAVLADASDAFKRAVKATARIGGATAFYLGKFNGHHVMASNHHVLPSEDRCLGETVRFPLLAQSHPCVKFFGEWTDVDLALFAIAVDDPAEEEALAAVGRNFAFDSILKPGTPLITAGFGVAQNPRRQLVANQDSDCVVFSGENETRYLADPDALNPMDYKVWSFANGCDISHGDSGSAFVHRETGEVLGLVWTGRIPKNPKVRDSAYLQGLLQNGGEDVWEQLTYGVPAAKIGEHLRSLLKGQLEDDTRATFNALLGLE